MRPFDTDILVGTNNLNFGGLRYRAKKIIQHEKFNGENSYDYDIALIQLQRSIQFNEHVQPIQMLPDVIPERTRLLVSGWDNVTVSSLKMLRKI